MKGLEITVSSGSTRNHGLHLVSNINTRYEGVNASANGGGQRAAALFVSSANPDIDGSYFSGTGASQFNYAAYISNGFFTLTNSTLSSNTSDSNNRASYHTGTGRTRVMNSMTTGLFICESPGLPLVDCFRCGGVYDREFGV